VAIASRRISGRCGWAGLAVAVSCPLLFNRLFYEVFVIKLPIKINRRIVLVLAYVSNLPPPLKSVPVESVQHRWAAAELEAFWFGALQS